jgi:hypothetical protein
MEDNKRKPVYVHEESPNVLPGQGIHIHDVAVVRERPQAAGLHLVQASTAEGARLGFGVPAKQCE